MEAEVGRDERERVRERVPEAERHERGGAQPERQGCLAGFGIHARGIAREMVPVEGLEPPTSRLRSDCSTN